MKKFFLAAFAALLVGFQTIQAIPAYPGKIVYTQPDGTKIVLRLHGDEFGHWATDAAGKAVRQDADGFFRRVSDEELAQIKEEANSRRAAARSLRAEAAQAPGHIAVGQKHFLVILVEYNDLEFSTSEDPQAAFTAMLNESGYSENGGTGSARDFYCENSHGYFEPIFDVYGPVKLSKNAAYYGGNDSRGSDKAPANAVAEGCRGLDGVIDFSRYDNDGDGKVDLVFMYYAGYGEADGGAPDTIWPHQWSLSSASINLTLDGVKIDQYACTNERLGYGSRRGAMCGIGAACHEFAHAMGLPDFYDTDYDTNGLSSGLFSFSTMDSGPYNNEGRTPPYFNIEERIMLGWLDESAIRDFVKARVYTIPSVDQNIAYRTPTDKEGEYFLYECRGANGWDAGLPAHGLIVYHVDKSDHRVSVSWYSQTAYELWTYWHGVNYINGNGSHPCFYVVPAAEQDNLSYGYHYYGGYLYFDESVNDRIPFPGSRRVTSYTPVSWSGTEGEISFTEIAYANDVVTLRASVPKLDLDYPTIVEAESYRVGDRFAFVLDIPEDAPVPASVVWYYDDEPAGADSVTLTTGTHSVEAHLSYADGAVEVLSLVLHVN